MRHTYDIYFDGRVDRDVLLRWPRHGERAAFGVQDHSLLVVAGGQWRSTSQGEFDAVVRATQRETDDPSRPVIPAGGSCPMQPGDMIDHSILVDTLAFQPVSHIKDLLDMNYWKQHALVDLTGVYVRKMIADTNLRVKDLRDQAGMHGYHLALGVVEYNLGLEELRIAVQLRSGRKIIQYFEMTRDGWSYGVGRGAWRPHLSADDFLNKLRNDRENLSWEKFTVYHETPDHCVDPLADCVRLSGTARDECFCVEYGLPCVTENLHGSGVILFVDGMNGFALPASLAEMQEQHDKVFHSQHSPSDD